MGDWKREGRTGRLGLRRKLMTDQREGSRIKQLQSHQMCPPVGQVGREVGRNESHKNSSEVRQGGSEAL